MTSVNDYDIKNLAIKNYPLDYEMQQYVYNKQLDAKAKMSKFEDNFKRKVIEEYPDDYEMQIYSCEELISKKKDEHIAVNKEVINYDKKKR